MAFITYFSNLTKLKRHSYSLVLEHDHRVVVQIAQVDLPSLNDDLGVFSAQQPANVAEEKAPVAVVRVGVRV